MLTFIITQNFNTFKLYPETELACKNWKSLIKNHLSENLLDIEKKFDMKTGKLRIPQNS